MPKKITKTKNNSTKGVKRGRDSDAAPELTPEAQQRIARLTMPARAPTVPVNDPAVFTGFDLEDEADPDDSGFDALSEGANARLDSIMAMEEPAPRAPDSEVSFDMFGDDGAGPAQPFHYPERANGAPAPKRAKVPAPPNPDRLTGRMWQQTVSSTEPSEPAEPVHELPRPHVSELTDLESMDEPNRLISPVAGAAIDVLDFYKELPSNAELGTLLRAMQGTEGAAAIYRMGRDSRLLTGYRLAQVMATIGANVDDPEERKRIIAEARASIRRTGGDAVFKPWVFDPPIAKKMSMTECFTFFNTTTRVITPPEAGNKVLDQPPVPMSPMKGHETSAVVDILTLGAVMAQMEVDFVCQVGGQTYKLNFARYIRYVKSAGQTTDVPQALISMLNHNYSRYPVQRTGYVTALPRRPAVRVIANLMGASVADPDERELIIEIIDTHAMSAGTMSGMKGRLLKGNNLRAAVSAMPPGFKPGGLHTAWKNGEFSWIPERYYEAGKQWFPFQASTRQFQTVCVPLLEAAHDGIVGANPQSDAGLEFWDTSSNPHRMQKKLSTALSSGMRATILLMAFESIATGDYTLREIDDKSRELANSAAARSLTTCAAKAKFEMLPITKVHEASRIIYVTQESATRPLAMLISEAVHSYSGDVDDTDVVLIGFSPFHQGLANLLARIDRNIERFGYSIFIMSDNAFFAFKHGGHIYFLSLDGKSMESSTRQSDVAMMMNRLLAETWGVAPSELSSHQLSAAWVLYARHYAPLLCADCPAVIGDAVIRAPGLVSGAPPTTMLNTDHMCLVWAEFMARKRDPKRPVDTKPYRDPLSFALDDLVNDVDSIEWSDNENGVAYGSATSGDLLPGGLLKQCMFANGVQLTVERLIRFTGSTLVDAAKATPIDWDLLGFTSLPIELGYGADKGITAALEYNRWVAHLPYSKTLPIDNEKKVAALDKLQSAFLLGGAQRPDLLPTIFGAYNTIAQSIRADPSEMDQIVMSYRGLDTEAETSFGEADLVANVSNYPALTPIGVWALQFDDDYAWTRATVTVVVGGAERAIGIVGLRNLRRLHAELVKNREQLERMVQGFGGMYDGRELSVSNTIAVVDDLARKAEPLVSAANAVARDRATNALLEITDDELDVMPARVGVRFNLPRPPPNQFAEALHHNPRAGAIGLLTQTDAAPVNATTRTGKRKWTPK